MHCGTTELPNRKAEADAEAKKADAEAKKADAEAKKADAEAKTAIELGRMDLQKQLIECARSGMDKEMFAKLAEVILQSSNAALPNA